MEESSAQIITSIQTSITSWLTPTVLFIFLNLIIATILFTYNNQQSPAQKPANQNHSKLHTSPSILHRLKSFTFTSPEHPPPTTTHHHHQQALQYVFHHPFTHQQDLPPSTLDFNRTNEETVTHLGFESEGVETDARPDEENDELESLDEVYSKITGGQVNRTKSDTLPASGEVPVKLPAKMKKSASLKSAFAHFEEDKIVEARRPSTVRERRSAARAAEEDDVEVDAKADDFINKFKHQLKLQRIDSIIRYKDMVNRGGAK